jgi:hypothetical protein
VLVLSGVRRKTVWTNTAWPKIIQLQIIRPKIVQPKIPWDRCEFVGNLL